MRPRSSYPYGKRPLTEKEIDEFVAAVQAARERRGDAARRAERIKIEAKRRELKAELEALERRHFISGEAEVIP